jgi:peroxidase
MDVCHFTLFFSRRGARRCRRGCTAWAATRARRTRRWTATTRRPCASSASPAGDNATLVDLDPTTPATFDADYYALVAGNRGLLSTDAALLGYPATRDYVERQAKAASPDEFFADFAEAFVAMSRLDVLTHHKGERDQEGLLLQGQPAVRVTQPAGGGAVPVVQRRRRCRC